MTSLKKFFGSKGCKGFTLLEILVATTVVAVAFTAIFRLFGGTLRSIVNAEKYTYAVVLGEQKMNEILLAEEGISPMVESDIFLENPGYSYDLEIAKYEEPIGREVASELTDLKALVAAYKVNLVVHWREGRKGKSLELSTLKTVIEENRL